MLRLGGKIEKRAFVAGKKVIKIRINGDIQQVPIIKTRPLELPVGDDKPHRSNQMQPRAGDGAGAGDIAGVLWNLGFHQNNVYTAIAAPPAVPPAGNQIAEQRLKGKPKPGIAARRIGRASSALDKAKCQFSRTLQRIAAQQRTGGDCAEQISGAG